MIRISLVAYLLIASVAGYSTSGLRGEAVDSIAAADEDNANDSQLLKESIRASLVDLMKVKDIGPAVQDTDE